MPDEYLPSVSLEFLKEQLLASDKLETSGEIGKTFYAVHKGTRPVANRTTLLRSIDGEIEHESALGISIRYKFLSKTMEWLYENKAWNEGGYSVMAASSNGEQE